MASAIDGKSHSNIRIDEGTNLAADTINLNAYNNTNADNIVGALTLSEKTRIGVGLGITLLDKETQVLVQDNDEYWQKLRKENVYGENTASASLDVYGVSVGGVLSVANNEAKAKALLTTNVNVNAAAVSKLSQINAHSSSNANHTLHANGDGGGLISISPDAAYTESKITLKTNTNLSNNLTADKISADAVGNAKGNLTSDAVQGELVGGCGTEALFDVELDTNVNVKDNAKLTANTIDLKSQNIITTGAERSKKNNKTKSYGLDTGARVDSDQNASSTSRINIGKNAVLLASEEINLDAFTKTDLFNKVQVGGAGLGSHLGSHCTNDYILNNYIFTDTGSLLKTHKKYADINLATSYDIKGDFSAYTEVEGAGAGNTFAEVVNKITNNNKIDINGNIYGYNDINFYTDQDSKGVLAKYNINNEAEAYTRAVIPWETDAEVDNTLKRNNNINISSNSTVNSVRHTTFSSGRIDNKLKNYTKEYNWYKKDTEGKTEDVSTVSEGSNKGGLTLSDNIKVDGKVIAGIHNKINVTIAGKVAFDENVTGDGIVRAPKIDCNTDEYKNSFKYGSMDYANELFTRYKEVEKLCAEYAGTRVGISYNAEKERLLAEMEKYGLYDRSKDDVIGKLPVQYIELPDMVCSGGNIYINAEKGDIVTGKGLIKAQGAPQIIVNNNSNLYMKVNDLTVVDPGGEIFLKERSLGKNAQTELKVNKAEADDPGDSLIRVNENWKNRYEANYTYVDPKDNKTKTETLTVTPLTNIEINGHIDNEFGNVIFYNANKDIVLQGKTASDSASVNGASISISAPNGSIAQGYTQGITNIGFTPEAVLKTFAKFEESAIISGLNLGEFSGKKERNLTLTEANIQSYVESYKRNPSGVNDSASGVWLAGGSVYLNGDDINVNGIIQSGYAKYELTLTENDKAIIEAIKSNYVNSGKPEITQSYLEQNCRINVSGMNWDKDKEAYNYVIQAFYNPKTDSIVVDDIQSNGGQIYITGRISNTSGGKILAADGPSDITIKNETGYKLETNILDVGDREGVIKIMDLGNNKDSNGNVIKDSKGNPILAKLTKMTSKGTEVWYVSKDGQTDEPQEKSGVSNVYNHAKGLTSVVTDASMLSGGTGLDVKGDRIDLTSKYGNIGTKDAMLKIQAGQELTKPGVTLSASVNAQGIGDIALEQTVGDMRIGKIISSTGDVYLNSAGSVLDALPPRAEDRDNQSAERLIEKWKELGIINDSGKDNSAERREEAITAYKNSVKTAYARYKDLKKRFDSDKNDTTSDTYKEYQKLKERFNDYSSAEKWLEAQNKDKNSQWYKLQNEVVYGWTQDALLYAIQDSVINREDGSTIAPTSPDDANIKARNVVIKAGGGIGRDEGYTVYDISNLQSEKGLEALKAIAGAEASDVKWGYDGNKADENKATINKVNSLKINAKGTLSASAKDNIYFEDCDNNAINLVSVSSTEGNVRVYGNNGIYNASGYKEGNANNKINLSGKDLIIEAGKGSIGTSKVPVTRDMFGNVTARSTGLINIYQIGKNALAFAAAYSGSNINIRALKNILSVYNGVQAEELGYINAKGNISLYSDEGDIGQANGKGLRVKLPDDKIINAEAYGSVYLKGYSDSKLNLGKIIAKTGNIGIDSKALDLILYNDMSAKSIEFVVKSITQIAGKLTVNNLLNIITDNGIILTSENNNVAQASLVNNKSGNIMLYNNRDLILNDVINKAEGGKLRIVNKGSVTSKNGLNSNGNLFIWSDGDIDIQKDSNATNWLGLYAENGSINAKSLFAESIDLSAKKNGLTAENIVAENYIKADVESGDINTEVVTSSNGEVTLIAHDGNISSKVIEAQKDINVVAFNGNLEVNSIENQEGDIEAVGYKSLKADSINASRNFFVGSLGDVILKYLSSGMNYGSVISNIFDIFTIEDQTSYLFGENINIELINVNNNFDSIANAKFNADKIQIGKKASITAKNDIEFDSIISAHDLNINSHDDGVIDIRELKVDEGNLSISNEIGNTFLSKIFVNGNANLCNTQKGGIYIDNLNLKNQGSFYANLKDGIITLLSGLIEGETSIYSQKGSAVITNIHCGKEVDIRTKDGTIFILQETLIGGDATLKSDTGSVLLSEADVVGNMKISSKEYSYIEYAKVGGSMLMKGDEVGAYAQTLKVGKDLIFNTNTGSIVVVDAQVGNNSYFSIDGPGKQIEIENIKTGHDLTGDLIVVSNSKKNNDNYIRIENAVAANKLIINSMSDIKLKSAYALNGKLEVKSAGDVVAEIISAAKNTFIQTLFGIINISKVISGDSVKIVNVLGEKTSIKDIQTTNPDADISIDALGSALEISNASATRDIKFKTFEGDVYIANVYAGKNISIDSYKSNIDITNTTVGNDINLNGGLGNINIGNTSVGNDINAELNGTMNLTDVTVGNNTNIITNNNSSVTINRFKSEGLDLNDKGESNIKVDNSEIGKGNLSINGSFDFTKSSSDEMTAVLNGKSSIIESKLGKADITNNSELLIEASEGNSIKTTNNSNLKVTKNSINNLNIINNNDALIENSTINSMTSVNNSNSRIELTNNLTVGSLELTNKGNALIHNSTIDNMSSTNEGQFELTATPVNYMNLINKAKGTAKIHDNSVKSMIASNDGDLNIKDITGEKLELTSAGNTNITDSNIDSINANNSGDLVVNNLKSNKVVLTSAGNTNIDDSNIININSNISGSAQINKLVSNSMSAEVSGSATINNSNIDNLNANISGSSIINNLVSSQMSFDNRGNTDISKASTSKITLTNSGKTSLKNIDVKANANLVNKNGNLSINTLKVANNFDLDSKSGNINMSGVDVNKDFNFALAGNSSVKFTDIAISNDFNVYAGKAVINGKTLKVGNNLNTYTYSKYFAPKTNLRAVVKQNSGNAKTKETDEGFTLILDQLNIGGGLYVDNPDVTIKVKKSTVGHDVDIDAGKEKIQIDKLDVDGGNLDIKGESGTVKLGKVKVDNDTKIKLDSGDLSAASLDSKGKVEFKVGGNINSTDKIISENSTVDAVAGGNLTASTVEAKGKIEFKSGGNITSDHIIKSENSTVNVVSGGNLTASTVEAKGKIDFNVGGNIASDKNIETETGSINMIAGGGVDAYKVLAKQQGNIEAVNGDIIIGQINGKTLVLKQDTNDRTLRIREANVETNITAGADYIDIDMINHTGNEDRLGIDFTLVNGRAMDNVVIKDIQTDKGVDMFNLVSMYGNIHVSNEIFNLTQTYLLKMGDLSNTKLKFRLFGDSPSYSKDPDIIAFFSPKVNHKMYADINFTNEGMPGHQDYIPLIAKGEFKRMFNQYTVVQEIESLRLAFEDRIEDVHDDSYYRFDYRKLNNSKSFYVDSSSDIYANGESINLGDIEIPVGVEFDSANGELRAVGTHLKPMVAED